RLVELQRQGEGPAPPDQPGRVRPYRVVDEVERAQHVVLAPAAPVAVGGTGLGELFLDGTEGHRVRPFRSRSRALPPAIAARSAGGSPAASRRATGSSTPMSKGWSVPSTTRSAPTSSTRWRSARGV